MSEIREQVREKYAATAVDCGGGRSCCEDEPGFGAELYRDDERAQLPDAAVLASLGCGDPTAGAGLAAGGAGAAPGPRSGGGARGGPRPPAASVDVVISTCVISLSPHKPAVLAEMFRVLRSGGRVGV